MFLHYVDNYFQLDEETFPNVRFHDMRGTKCGSLGVMSQHKDFALSN